MKLPIRQSETSGSDKLAVAVLHRELQSRNPVVAVLLCVKLYLSRTFKNLWNEKVPFRFIEFTYGGID